MRRELVIGRVRTAHGVRGELKVEPLSGETGHFRSLEEVTLVRRDRSGAEQRRTVAVESVRLAHRLVLLKLAGVDAPEQAKAWRGWEIVVDRERAASLAEGEYYYADLVGLRVICDKSDVGVVADVWEGGPAVLLGIELSAGEQRLVPFQAEFVSRVDLDQGTLEIATAEVLE